MEITQNDNLEEYQSVWTDLHFRKPADAAGQVVIRAAGHHPRCRITKVTYDVLAYANVADQFVIEELNGTDHTTAVACGTAIGVATDMTITDDIFERNEAICFNLTVDGDPANAGIIAIRCESVHS